MGQNVGKKRPMGHFSDFLERKNVGNVGKMWEILWLWDTFFPHLGQKVGKKRPVKNAVFMRVCGFLGHFSTFFFN